jgi:drug/metabolite transporter (DMT)-like permease
MHDGCENHFAFARVCFFELLISLYRSNCGSCPGCFFVVLGALGFSAKAVLIKLAYADSNQFDAITLMVPRMAISLPFLLVIALWSANASAKTKRCSGVEQAGSFDDSRFGNIGLLPVLPAFLMNAGIRRIGAGSASIISSTGPIGTLGLAFLLLGERLTLA